MLKNADPDGRYKLSYREYTALRNIFGVKNALLLNYRELESRSRSVKNGWRDLRMLMAVLDKYLLAILRTIPTDKLKALKAELEKTYCELRVEGPMGKALPESCVYVPETDLEDVVTKAMDYQCFGCNKTHRAAKRDCPIYKTYQNLYHYEFEDCVGCPFADTEN